LIEQVMPVVRQLEIQQHTGGECLHAIPFVISTTSSEST